MMKLYQFEGCPFCAKVRNKIEELGISDQVELIEASRGTPGREEANKLGGGDQVPFLVDGETMMYESSDIVEYLENKFRKEE